jgi:predicted ArsR family transcriptional regulator
VKQPTRCQILRQLLASAPLTCAEIAALTGLSPRRAWVAVWVLTSQGHARAVGRRPKEDGATGHGHNLYELTARGRYALKRDLSI